jgi:flagellar biogenesis protein FliO
MRTKITINRKIDEVISYVKQESTYRHPRVGLSKRYTSGIITWEFKRRRLYMSFISDGSKSLDIIGECKFNSINNNTIVLIDVHYPRLLVVSFAIATIAFLQIDYKILKSLFHKNNDVMTIMSDLMKEENNFVLLSILIITFFLVISFIIKKLAQKQIIKQFKEYIVEPMTSE